MRELVDITALLLSRIRDVADYPEPGVMFKDITPLLADPAAFSALTDALAAVAADTGATKVVGLEARGFILGAPVAYERRAGLVPVRKVGKLPAATMTQGYTLEYGEAVLEMHADALAVADRVLVVDDVVATGGTALATVELVRRTGAEVVGIAALLEVAGLGGRDLLADYDLRLLLPAS